MVRQATILGLIVCIAACAKRPAVETDPRQGEVGYRFLFDASFAASLPSDQEFQVPRVLGSLATPDYPPHALEAGAGSATVAVRFVIGTDGSVVRILDSPKLASTEGSFAADFRQAVEDVVRSWRFTPGALRTFAPGTDLDGDGTPDYKVEVASRLLEVAYDVAFEFSVVDGRGEVSVPVTETRIDGH